jgi:hypothetical protein
VRPLALLLLLVATPAWADDDDGGEPEYRGFPTVSLGAALQFHGTELAGHYESGAGLAVELAFGSGRWQVTGEGAVASSARMERTGSTTHGAVGLRWLARQFSPADGGAIELFVTGAAGAQHYDVDDLTTTRGELMLGSGMQLRLFRRPRLVVRFDARAVFTGSDHTGYLIAMGGAW